jgi:uncharacterized membrane protein required for colicin V production
MLMDFLTGLNWIDILMAVVFARIILIGIKNGFVVEFFKFCGIIFSVFVTLHYYSVFADFLTPQVPVLEPTAVRILIFLALWLLVTCVFMLVRDGLMALFSVKPHSAIDKWGGAVLAVLRGLIVCSMTFFVLLLSLNPTVLKLSETSWSRPVVGSLATHVYFGIYWSVVNRFFPAEPVNQEALDVPKLLERKNK